ncbi:uncharacterized protein LOC34623038 [Cyclospora cayetanensis]|uniref:Uncharacterized protein LOC34623038 n=1 Tax=Cyclospora cayetanensis TaxID=88456 RepID=A0A6P6S465_9EIME|nr:uncharacterized protein LOC34623038 [Cyclospora cayetanensis]
MSTKRGARQGPLSSGPEWSCAAALSPSDRQYLFSIRNPRFLFAVRRELRRHDASRSSGLLTAEVFSLCLAHMGIQFGSPEADFILRFCEVTPDGFVICKSLLLQTYPYKQRHADTVALSFAAAEDDEEPLPCWSSEESAAPSCGAKMPLKASGGAIGDPLGGGKGALVRRLFAQWERCLLRDCDLKRALKAAGFGISEDLERLLSLQGPGGSIQFKDFMRCLMSEGEAAQGRGGLGVSREVLDAATAALAAERTAFIDPPRNAVTWEPPASVAGTGAATTSEILNPLFLEGADRRAFLLRLTSLFLSSCVPSESFRGYLNRVGIAITPEIDTCIREEMASGCVPLSRMMAAIWQAEHQQQREQQQQQERDLRQRRLLRSSVSPQLSVRKKYVLTSAQTHLEKKAKRRETIRMRSRKNQSAVAADIATVQSNFPSWLDLFCNKHNDDVEAPSFRFFGGGSDAELPIESPPFRDRRCRQLAEEAGVCSVCIHATIRDAFKGPSLTCIYAVLWLLDAVISVRRRGAVCVTGPKSLYVSSMEPGRSRSGECVSPVVPLILLPLFLPQQLKEISLGPRAH